MAAIIAIVTSLAMLIFWLSRAASGAADAAGDIANLPRRLRYAKKAGKSGLALITDAREAAAVLMVSVARLSGDGRVSEAEIAMTENLLVSNMRWPKDEVEEFVTNICWISRDLKQPSSTLRPMANLLQNSISKKEADDLAHMLTEIAICDNAATQSQTQFIYQYREYMGLNAA